MENLFDYATKELSQDAFLRWLFQSYDDPVVGEVSNCLLGEFCHFQDGEKVGSLHTEAQKNKIDISAWITTTLGRKIALFIEDKTFSNEHHQLETYDSYIDRINDHAIYKVFYKINVIDSEEKSRIEKANEKNKVRWVVYDIEGLYSFFGKHKESENMILSQYAEHVEKIYNAVKNTKKPQTNDTTVDFLKWQAYFTNIIIPALKGCGTSFMCGSWKAGQYPYVVLYVKKLGYGQRKIPYLEIQSRDCVKDSFKAKILCYNIEIEDVWQQQVLMDNIKANPAFECKKIRMKKRGVENYFPKQVGYSPDGLNAATDKAFIALVEKYIAGYLDVMKDWK